MNSDTVTKSRHMWCDVVLRTLEALESYLNFPVSQLSFKSKIVFFP